MSNNKLYTEEQLKEAFNCGRLYLGREGDTNFYHLIDKLIPIELPSDEEIEQEANLITDLSMRSVYILGSKSMRNKIQGGNK